MRMRIAERPRTRELLGLTLRQHIGGRWAISLLAYGINAPVNLLGISSNADRSTSSGSAAQWLLVALAGYLALGAVFLLGDLTYFRHRRIAPVAIGAVVALGLVAGLVRGIVVALLAQDWGLSITGLVLTRVLTSAALGAVMVPLGALVLSVVATYIVRRRELLVVRTELQAARLRAEGATDAMRIALLESVRGDLEEVVRTQDPELARSVSHRVWEETREIPSPHLRWSDVVLACLVRNPFPGVTVAAIWAISALGALTAALGLGPALLQMLFSMAAIIGLFAAGRAWSSRAGTSAIAFPVMVLAVLLVTGPLASAIFDPRPLGDGMRLIIANTVWLPMLIVLVSIAFTAVRSSELVLQVLEDQVTQAEVDAVAAQGENQRVRRDLATTLHGTVQSRLLAAAAIMQQPGLVPDGATAAVAGLDQLLLAADSSTVPSNADSALMRIESAVRPWRSLMDVSVEFDGDIDREMTIDAVVRIIEEGLSNAFRHGQADVVACEVRVEAEDVLITVRDNGQGSTSQAHGLGSALLDALAPGAWTLVSTGNGCLLSARLVGTH